MAEAVSSHPPRPRLALRVGVTGARRLVARMPEAASDQAAADPPDLAPERQDNIRADVEEVLRSVAKKLRGLENEVETRAVYAGGPAILRLISPLALGADRIVARAARDAAPDADYELYAPLPFASDVYKTDFPKDDTEFDELIKDCAVLELDGDREQEEESYREVGRFVVRNSDLVIAIWDGSPVKKVGGTSEILRFALQTRVPVWWIDAYGEAPPRLLLRVADLRNKEEAPRGEAAHSALNYYLDRVLIPPQEGRILAPLMHYLGEDVSPDSWMWRRLAFFKNSYKAMLTAFSIFSRRYPNFELKPKGRWRPYVSCADKLANDYADAYRNAYVWIAFFAFLALTAPAFGRFVPARQPLASCVEAASLVAIAALVWRSTKMKYHERWIACRLLAELCRQQFVLSLSGRSIPVSECESMAGDERVCVAPERPEAEPPCEAWAAWYFAATQRADFLPRGKIAKRNEKAHRIGKELVEEQRGYHRNRLERQQTAGERVSLAGLASFGVTLGLVLTPFVMKAFGMEFAEPKAKWMEFGVGLFSALSAALLGVRAYAEFFLLTRQSQLMLRALEEADRELDSIDPTAPLASRDLGRALFTLALEMMEDIKGWSQLYGVKHIEPG